MNEETLFLAALAKPAAERAAFLSQACAGQPQLLAAVKALLAAHERSGNVLDRPAAAAPLATGEFTPEPDAAPPHPAKTTDFQPQAGPGVVIAGRYTLVEKIGEGGMGEVWVAKQTEPVKRRVALKLIKAGMDTKAVLQRFEAERQALAMMDHPNIAKVLDGGMTGKKDEGGRMKDEKDRKSDSSFILHPSSLGRPFFVMELVNGLALTRFCDEAKLGIRERLNLFAAICQAVQHAHQKGIIHRDLKPSNILVTLIDARPVPKVIDFGVAKAIGGKLLDESLSTQFGAVVGTLEYMSPEQAGFSGTDIDTRADIYSLGVILYELLTGLRPIDAKRLRKAAHTEMIRIIQEEEPSKPSTRLSTDESLPSLAAMRQTEPKKLMALLRGELDWVVMKCLEKQRERRYETANALARDVQRYLADELVEARPPSTGYRLKKFVRRNRGAVLAAGIIFMALVGGLLMLHGGVTAARYGLMRARDAEKAARADQEEADRQREKALAAAAAEKAANEQTQKRLQQIERGTEILASVFRDLEPQSEEKEGVTLRVLLGRRLGEAVKQLDGETVGDPLVVARLQIALGRSLRELGHYELAEVVLSKAVRTLTASRGPDHPDSLNAKTELAIICYRRGQGARGEQLYKEVLDACTKKLGANHVETLGAKNNLAMLYLDQKNYPQALTLFNEVLEGRIDKLGANHLDTLNTKHGLAVVFNEEKKYARAEPLYKEVLEGRTKQLGPDHPDTITAKNDLALLYQHQGKFLDAEKVYREVLEVQTPKLGADHPANLAIKHNLATVYRDLRKYALAETLFQEVLEGRTIKLGPDHPETIKSKNSLALLYWSMKKWDRVIPLCEELVRQSKKLHGAEHPDTARALLNLAIIYRDSGRLDEGIRCFEEALATLNQSPDSSSDQIELLTQILAQTYDQAKQYAKAESLYRTLLDKSRHEFGAEDRHTALRLSELGHNLLAQKKHDEAEMTLRACTAICDKQLPNKWGTFDTKSMLGGALLGQKKYADAEPLLLAGYEGMKQREKTIPPLGQVRLPEAIERLVQLYEAMDKKDDAAKWRKELEATKAVQPNVEAKP